MLDPTAVHEAGHAVAAHALGFVVFTVSVIPKRVPEGIEHGFVTFNNNSVPAQMRDRVLAERHFLATFGGPVAEVNLFRLGTWQQRHAALWHERGDFGRIRPLLEHHAAENLDAYFLGLFRRTRALLAIRRRQIVAVSTALMRECELDAAGFLEAIA